MTSNFPKKHKIQIPVFSTCPETYCEALICQSAALWQILGTLSADSSDAHSPRCSSITVLSVRGMTLFLTFACPRFKMSSRTDFRFGNLREAEGSSITAPPRPWQAAVCWQRSPVAWLRSLPTPSPGLSPTHCSWDAWEAYTQRR